MPIHDIQHILYINLDHRTDRKCHIEKELAALGWLERSMRFPAVSLKNGAAGCSMSHLKCLEIAKKEKWSHVLIVEDDLECLDVEFFQQQLNLFLRSGTDWDVCLLAGNNMLPYLPHNEASIQVMNCQTTTAYLVQEHYYPTLMANIRQGIQELLKYPERKVEFAIDKYWLRLQQADRWYLVVPLTLVQRKDYSDVEKKTTDYRRYMLDYNKVVR